MAELALHPRPAQQIGRVRNVVGWLFHRRLRTDKGLTIVAIRATRGDARVTHHRQR